MKFNQLFSIAALIAVIFAFGCSPEHVEPTDAPGEPMIAANLENDDEHKPPRPECSAVKTINLVNTQFGPAFPLGTAKTVNSDIELYTGFEPNPGIFVRNVDFWWGDADANELPPLDANGNPDRALYPIKISVTPVNNVYSVRVPIEEIFKNTRISFWLDLVLTDPNGNPTFAFPAWGYENPIGTGAWYPFAPEANCPQLSCEPWINANNPCPPPCEVPSGIGPGDDLSEYSCGNPKANKVTVCHLPPGNPANMQEICISVNALPAHIIDFKPANNPCMGHHSGCHLGPCDPCGPGTTADYAAGISSNCPGN